MNLKISVSISLKRKPRLLQLSLILFITLASTGVLRFFIFPFHEHGMSFQLFMSSLISTIFVVCIRISLLSINLILGIVYFMMLLQMRLF